jgi:PIN domain nuclease of toxin-antitoxin system
VKALLDTHTLLYAANEPERLGVHALHIINNRETVLYASHASLWEIVIKVKVGKLSLPVSPPAFWAEALARLNVRELYIRPDSILKTFDFDLSHRDPFDRLLAAQASIEDLTFISSDSAVDVWGIKRVW